MSIVSYALSGNYKRFNENLKNISKKENINLFTLKKKFVYCLITSGMGYSDFLNYELYKKSNKEIQEYASIKNQDSFYEIVSPAKYKKFFTVKPDFLKNFSQYINRDYFYNGTFGELETFIKNNKIFVQKPIDGLGGHGVIKKDSHNIKNIHKYYEEVMNENILLEGYVNQHSSINKICSKSVNTIRIMTFCVNGVSEILFAVFRIGNGDADIDNFHTGGMAVLVDIKTGKLIGDAVDKNLKRYKKHPKSDFTFSGFQIPNWDIIQRTVLEAAKINENIHLIGWDVAVTENGCTLIEGNRRPGFDIVQVVSGYGRKDLMRYSLYKLNRAKNTNYKI